MRFLLPVAAALALALLPAIAGAEPMKFGERSVEIPAPEGFLPVADQAPLLRQITQDFLPPETRLVEIYLTPADLATANAEGATGMSQYAQVQAMRAADGVPVSTEEFAMLHENLRTTIEAEMARIEALAGQMAAKGNAALQEITGTDANVSVSGVRYHGIYRNEPWGLFFTASSDVSLAGTGMETEQARVTSAVGVVLLDQQIVFFSAYDDRPEETARAWVQATVAAWADAARAANAK
jgi:hypothetical protein